MNLLIIFSNFHLRLFAAITSVVWHDGSDACYTVHSCEMCLYIYLVLGIWIFTALITHHFLVQNKKNTILKDVQKKLSNVLFLIAHPDDECMFFGPAITSLTRQTDSSSSKKKAAKNIYILCLSDGEYFSFFPVQLALT